MMTQNSHRDTEILDAMAVTVVGHRGPVFLHHHRKESSGRAESHETLLRRHDAI